MQQTSLEVRPVEVHDDAQMRRFHEIGWRAEKEDGRPWNAFWTYDEMAVMFREPSRDHHMAGYAAFDGEDMVGGGIVSWSVLDNLDKGFVFAAVEPELRRRGIGSSLLEGLVGVVLASGRSEVLADAVVPWDAREDSPTLAFAARHGFERVNTEIYRILPLPVREGLLDELAAAAAPHHEDFRVETYVDDLPDRYLTSYAHLLNQLAADAPTGDVDFEAHTATPEMVHERMQRNRRAGRRTHVSVAVDPAGEVVAHSDLFVTGSETVAHQMGTLVRRDRRGHRLGTAVKVANLAALQQDRPDVTEVHTQNAETNSWMVDINVRLGFEPVGICPAFRQRPPAAG